jgi:hypothetical protein
MLLGLYRSLLGLGLFGILVQYLDDGVGVVLLDTPREAVGAVG